MDFMPKLPNKSNGFDSIEVVVQKVTKSAHFLLIKENLRNRKTD